MNRRDIMKVSPVAYMDSGVGGLTVAKVALEKLPHENMIYLGDEARLPYGEKTIDEVRQYSAEIGHFFVDQGAKMMVIACNTATAAALSYLRKLLPIPVIGVIEPGSMAAVKKTKNKKIGVIATRGTVASHSYRDTIQKIDPSIEVKEVACPTFIPLVESGKYHSKDAQAKVQEGLKPFQNSGIDTLILGCTHFPIIADLIGNVMGPDVTLVNPGYETVNAVERELKDTDHLENVAHPSAQFYTTADVKRFDEVGKQWLHTDIDAKLIPVKQLEKY